MTENFKDEIWSKLDLSKARKSAKTSKYYLNKIVEEIQTLNGAQKNKLAPNGTSEQNAKYNKDLQDRVANLPEYARYVGCGLELIQDSKTGLYKLKIKNEVFDVPERKVAIVNKDTEAGQILEPQIVD